MKRLPDKPSELAELALADLEATEKDPRYVVDMGHWHLAVPELPCAVCLAGSVMAKSLGVMIMETRHPNEFDLDTATKLVALDEIRGGCPEEFIKSLGYDGWIKFPDMTTPYYRDPKAFKDWLRDVIDVLKENNL